MLARRLMQMHSFGPIGVHGVSDPSIGMPIGLVFETDCRDLPSRNIKVVEPHCDLRPFELKVSDSDRDWLELRRGRGTECDRRKGSHAAQENANSKSKVHA